MNETDLLMWIQAVTAGTPLPGEYQPGTNPLDVMSAT